MTDLIRSVTQVTSELSCLAKEGYDLEDVTRIWAELPLQDSEGLSYLEAASQCILEVSNLVDKTFPKLDNNQSIAKKYLLMAKLLTLKADQLMMLK